MATLPRRTQAWTPPVARAQGERLLAARAAEQRAAAALAEAKKLEAKAAQEDQSVKDELADLKAEIAALKQDLPKIIPGGGGKRMVAKVLERDSSVQQAVEAIVLPKVFPPGGSTGQVLAKSSNGELYWANPVEGSDAGGLIAANNLADVADPEIARANLGLDGLYQPFSGVLAGTTASFTTTLEGKLSGIEPGATANAPDAALINRANHTGTQSADTLTDGTANKVFTAAEKTKLGDIATGATKNATDATLLSRGNHTGTQSADTIVDGTANKAFTAAEKTKLANIGVAAATPAFLVHRTNSATNAMVEFRNNAGTSVYAGMGSSGVFAIDGDADATAGAKFTVDTVTQTIGGQVMATKTEGEAGTATGKLPDVVRVKQAIDIRVGFFNITDPQFGGITNSTGATSQQTTIAAAVAAAYATGKQLYWPAGTYLTTASIPNFHAVRHFGPGVVKRGTRLFYVSPKAGQANTLYCDASASDDLGDGLDSSTPIQQISTAANYLSNYGPFLDGSWTIQAAAGTYKGGIYPGRNMTGRDFIKIQGPSVGGHPNVPTVIIDKAADTSKTYGVFATDGALLWLENIKVNGAFAQGVYVSRNVYLQYRNVHVDGAVTGLQVNNQCRYSVTGGIIQNCTTGISELFHVDRDFSTVSSASQQIIIRSCEWGLKSKENCIGHTDYINFEDCGTGLELQLFSGTNPKGAVFKRCGIGIVLVNGELHNEATIVWGAGADACTRRILELGNSATLNTFGWLDTTGNPTIRTGHRPMVLLYGSYTQTDHTGTTAETTIVKPAAVLKQDVYAVQGKRYRVVVYGSIPSGTTLLGTVRMLLRVNGYLTDVTIPSGVVGTVPFRAEFDVVCTADGANQFATSALIMKGAQDATGIARTVDMSGADRSLEISCILANVADKVRFNVIEVWG